MISTFFLSLSQIDRENRNRLNIVYYITGRSDSRRPPENKYRLREPREVGSGQNMIKPIRFSVYFLAAIFFAAGASAQSPALPIISDNVETNSALLSPPRRVTPPMPGLSNPNKDLVITSELDKANPDPVVITDRAELELALEQLRDAHGLRPTISSPMYSKFLPPRGVR